MLERVADAVREPVLGDDDGGVADDLEQRLVAHGDDRRAARHRLEHRQAEALVEGRLHEARGAAVEGGELLDLDVAAQRRAALAELARPSTASFSGPTTTSGSPTSWAASSAASWFFRGWTAPTERT